MTMAKSRRLTRYFLIIVCCAIYCTFLQPVLASDSQTSKSAYIPVKVERLNKIIQERETYKAQHAWLSASTILFLFLSLSLVLAVRWQAKLSEEACLKLSGLVLIVGGAMYLITAGFSKEQINPILAIFGTIAGYLLAKEHRSDSKEKTNEIQVKPLLQRNKTKDGVPHEAATSEVNQITGKE